jgi:hypothetical protein
MALVIKNSLRPLLRGKNKLQFWLNMEDWPKDIPLPDETILATTGEGPFRPYQVVYLEPDKTVETVIGWFIVPLSPERTFKWYQNEMVKRGYVEQERGDTLPTWALLRYCQPETNVRVRISIQCNPHLNQTRVMIQRSVIHPWSPPSNGKRAGANAKPATRTPKGEKRRVVRKARRRVVA